jgi:pimeloyl-ACP methyl ester carboxylesterase
LVVRRRGRSLRAQADSHGGLLTSLSSDPYRSMLPIKGRSIGPMTKITLQDFARDIAEVVKAHGGGKAVVVGHAYGNWVARMTATDFPALVRGVVIAAGPAKQYLPELAATVPPRLTLTEA